MGAIEKRTAVQDVCAQIAGQEMAAKIRQALPPNLTLERFVRVTLTAVQQNPELVTVTGGSLYQSIIRCAQDGLLPDGREAALVIYKTKGEKQVQYLPMIGGLRKVAAKHKINLAAYVVYAHDEFHYELGIEPVVRHKPPPLDHDRGDPIGAYAVATDNRGQHYLEVMSRQEIEAVRRVSRAATSEYGPWVNWWGEMARKTVARRLFKQLPLTDLDERATRVIEASDADTELPQPPRMTIEEANLSAQLVAALPDDGGPDDLIEGEALEDPEGGSNAGGEPVPAAAPGDAGQAAPPPEETGGALFVEPPGVRHQRREAGLE